MVKISRHYLLDQALSFLKSFDFFLVSLLAQQGYYQYYLHLYKYAVVGLLRNNEACIYYVSNFRGQYFCNYWIGILLSLIISVIPSKLMGKKNIQGSSIEKQGKKIDCKEVVSEKFDEKLLLSQQKQLEMLCRNAQKNGKLEKFEKVKYKQIIYEVGEFIHLFSELETLPFIARLDSILRITGQVDIKAILRVEWLMRKQNLPKKLQNEIKNFSTAEVFPSGQIDYVYIQSIKGKCNVLTYHQYQFLRNTGDSIHFTRAVYDPKTNSLLPPMSEWEKTCYCNTPPNPDLAYIQCDKCEMWIHQDCIENKQEAELQTFICKNCSAKSLKKRR